jgi:O-antigen ligase
MQISAEKGFLQKSILTVVALTTIAITPFSMQDPFNLIKMCVIAFVAVLALAVAAINWNEISAGTPRYIIAIIGVFIIWMVLVTFLSPRSFAEQIFGVYGRNTGFLTYLALSTLLLISIFISSQNFVSKFLNLIIGVTIPIQIYGHLQFIGIEFFQYNSIYNSKVFSTFGNPNFHAAFLGMTLMVCLVKVLDPSSRTWVRIFLVLLSLGSLVGIFATKSIQGFVTPLIASILVVAFIALQSKRFRIFGFGIFLFIGATLTTLVFNLAKLPVLTALYQEGSVVSRRYYWEAAINMLLNSPVRGVGMDGYGDWFLRSRSQNAFDFNRGLLTNSSHNQVLDIAANGGVVLASLYLSLMFFTVRQIFKQFKSQGAPNSNFIALTGFWFAYQLQSLISINQIGIGIWGWITTGLILGYSKTNVAKSEDLKINPRKNIDRVPLKPKSIIASFVGVILGLSVSLPPYLAASSYFSALSTNDPRLIFQSAGIRPHDQQRFIQVAQIMFSSNLSEEALYVIRQGLIEFPDSIQMWDLLGRIPSSTASEKARSEKEILRLDPLRFNDQVRG